MADLFIRQLPSAFASIGEKHNALVDVVKSMSGAGGISVKVSDANVIIDGSGISVTGGGGTEGDPIQVVGSTGLLNTVPKHSTWATPTTYPTDLAIVNGSVTASMNVAGFGYEDANATLAAAAYGVTYVRGSDSFYANPSGFFYRTASATFVADASGIYYQTSTASATINDTGFYIASGALAADVTTAGFAYEDASITAVLGASGLSIEDNGTNQMLVDELGIDWSDGTSAWGISSTGLRYSDPAVLARFGDAGVQWTDGTNSFAATTIGFLMVTSTGSVSIPFSAVSGAIQLREIDVCVDGVNRKMLILASDWY